MTNFIFDRPHERTTKIDDRKCSNIVPKLQMKKTPLKLYIYHRWSSLSQNRSVVGEGGSYTQTIKSMCVCVWGGEGGQTLGRNYLWGSNIFFLLSKSQPTPVLNYKFPHPLFNKLCWWCCCYLVPKIQERFEKYLYDDKFMKFVVRLFI